MLEKREKILQLFMGGISIGQLVSKARRTSEKQRHVNRPSMLHTADLSHRRVSTSAKTVRSMADKKAHLWDMCSAFFWGGIFADC